MKVGKQNNKGFTLLEILVVMGLLVVIAATPLFVDTNNFRGRSFQAEQSQLASALQTARARSFNNISQKKHGVAINPGSFEGYVIFEGDSYATRDISKDEEIKASYTVTFAPLTPDEITFEQLSGNANFNGDITITDSQRGIGSSITINSEGKISW